jgi:four helix bundle protein
MKTENAILEMSFNFSLQIIDLYKILIQNKEYVLSKQILRSGTSIGANIEEAMAAEEHIINILTKIVKTTQETGA